MNHVRSNGDTGCSRLRIPVAAVVRVGSSIPAAVSSVDELLQLPYGCVLVDPHGSLLQARGDRDLNLRCVMQ